MTSAPALVPAASAEGVSFAYRRAAGRSAGTVGSAAHDVLREVSFAVAPGSLFGVLGPNGSGKSTLFRLLATLARPRRGRLSVFGHDLGPEPAAVRRLLGVVFQSPALDPYLSAEENLAVHGRLLGLGGARLAEGIAAELDRFGLERHRHDRVRTLSGGTRRRVELAKALLGRPRLLLLDEPSTGLDPSARLELRRSLLELRGAGTTVLLTTHLMEEADLCDRLLLLDGGRVVAEDAPAALRAALGGDVVRLEGRDPARLREVVLALRPELAGRLAASETGGVRFEHPQARDLAAALLARFGEVIESLAIERPTLEDVFVHHTGHGLSGGASAVSARAPDPLSPPVAPGAAATAQGRTARHDTTGAG